MTDGWIGVDLDGTLAHYDGWVGPVNIGAPVPRMVTRVRWWIEAGYTVKIFTARISEPDVPTRVAIVDAIREWCETHIGHRLEVTNIKDTEMLELWDDRAVQVERNTGRGIGYSTRGLS